VEDVVSLGSDITVRVDDIDPQGKVALSPVGDDATNGSDGPPARRSSGSDETSPSSVSSAAASSAAADAPDGREFVSFEDQFESQVKEKFGDLGPAEPAGRPQGAGGAGDSPRRNRDRDRRRSR
jgi:polyribonucleotide nucleotidyltransferase